MVKPRMEVAPVAYQGADAPRKSPSSMPWSTFTRTSGASTGEIVGMSEQSVGVRFGDCGIDQADCSPRDRANPTQVLITK
jgi:hypothetical protein